MKKLILIIFFCAVKLNAQKLPEFKAIQNLKLQAAFRPLNLKTENIITFDEIKTYHKPVILFQNNSNIFNPKNATTVQGAIALGLFDTLFSSIKFKL